MIADVEHLTREGWARIPGVVPAEDLADLIKACQRLTEEGPAIAANSSSLARDEAAMAALLGDRVLRTVIGILGERPVLLPSITVRKNVYVDWHIDGAFRDGLAGCRAETDFLQCAIYLSPNRSTGGGGLSVVPRSHQRRDIEGVQYVPASILSLSHTRMAIESDPGDLIVWDGRTLHASSPALQGMNDRFGLFASFARRDAPVQAFLDHLARRAIETRRDGNVRENRRYRDAFSLQYPADFHPEIVRRLDAFGVTVATRTAEAAE